MYQKIIMLLICLLVSGTTWAAQYFYLENPDPTHYKIVWKGNAPNCHITAPNGYEIYGWIGHDTWPEYMNIVPLDNPSFGALEWSVDDTENTRWATFTQLYSLSHLGLRSSLTKEKFCL